MQVIDSFKGLKDKYQRIVVAMGNFDGLHLGHQRLINETVENARRVGGTATVLTFYPHPLAVLRPENSPPLLLTRAGKEKIMARLGVDVLVMVPFTREFALISPEDYVREILCREMAVDGVVVGYNFTFGHRGKGTAETLWSYAEKYGFNLNVIPPVKLEDQVVSSSLIRQLILDGDIQRANRYLGYQYYVEETVVTGDRRGNLLGFPTANLELPRDLLVPPNGVYSVYVTVDDDVFLGVANIGVKPTFKSDNLHRNIEIHLLDFYGNLYDKKIKAQFIRRLRPEKKFNSVTELVNQIQADVQQARADYPK